MSNFLREIEQQPIALREVVDQYREKYDRVLKEVVNEYNSKKYKKLVFTGIGTSYFVSLIIQHKLSEIGVDSVTYEAGELLHYSLSAIRENSLLIAISQSGESIETKKVVESVNKRTKVVSITNNLESSIARNSDYILPLCAGHEESITNKTYTNTLAVLLMLSSTLINKNIDETGNKIITCSNCLEQFLKTEQKKIQEIASFFKSTIFLHFISRGPSMAAAYQAALVFNEGARLYTDALPAGSFRHGPFELVGDGHCAVFLTPKGRTYNLLVSMAKEVSRLGSKVLLLTNEEQEDMNANVYQLVLEPSEEEYFSMIVSTPIELLLNEMAKDRGIEAGKFERGSKITSKE